MTTMYFYLFSKGRITNFILSFFSEIILCQPNPCRHGGQCIVISSRQFSCDCEQTGYKGNLCERGVVSPPVFPKLIPGQPSERLEVCAKPENSLTVNLHPTMNLSIQPEKLIIQYPASKAEFQITGYNSGVGMVMYSLDGVNKYDFTAPPNSVLVIGRKVSSQDSVYTKLGLLAGELPVGCQRMEIKKFPAFDVKIAFYANSTASNPLVIEPGPVHIITFDNKTIPLSLAGYDFSSAPPSQKNTMERLIRLTSISDAWQTGNQMSDCYNIGFTGKDLIEFIQTEAFSRSFLRYITDQLPLWLRLGVREEQSNLFDIGNIQSNLFLTTDTHLSYPICKFPAHIQSTLVLYRPTLNYNISVENNHLLLSSKGSCFAADISEPGVFLAFSQRARKQFTTMQFMQHLTLGGWKLLVSSFGFTTPRGNNTFANSVPNGHLVGNFSDFYYNWWWQGSANVDLSNEDQAVNMKMSGDAFAFTEDLDAVSTDFSLTDSFKKKNNFHILFHISQ